MLGGGGGAAEGGVHDHHPLAVGGGQVHVVGADAGAADHLEPAGRLEDRFVDQGAAAYHQGVGIDHRGQQLLGGEPRLVVDLEPFGLVEDRQSLGGKSVGNENFHASPSAEVPNTVN